MSVSRTIWLEVEDVIRHLRWTARVTGIQRVAVELARAALEDPAAGVKLCRMSYATGRLKVLDGLAARSLVRGGTSGAGLFLHALARGGREVLSGHAPGAPRPGDILMSPGASWKCRRYLDFVRQLKQRDGLTFAALIHDIIPLTHPQFAYRTDHVPYFRRWLQETVSVADLLFANSLATKDALLGYAAAQGWPLCAVQTIRFGEGVAPAPRDVDCPAAEPFVLAVSTLEVRKNHLLLVHVWERLVAKHGLEAVPTLVLAGKKGWLVDDLFRELKRTNWVSGKILWQARLDDAKLSRMYRDCLFVVHASWCEGWGFPVTEALNHGALCIASHDGAIREAGGDLVEYFDPADPDDAFERIERAVFDTAYREAAKRRVVDQYRWSSWAACLNQITEAARATPSSGRPIVPSSRRGAAAETETAHSSVRPSDEPIPPCA